MGNTPHSDKSLFSEFVEAIIDQRLGDFLRARKPPSSLLTSKIREGNVHGSAWQTMLQHAAGAGQLGEVVTALSDYGEEITAAQLDQASRGGMKAMLSQSDPEQAHVITGILKNSGNAPAYADIIAPFPDKLDHYIVTTRFDTLLAVLDDLGHSLQPEDILREDNAGRTMLQNALQDKSGIPAAAMLGFLEQSGMRINIAQFEKFYSTHQTFLGQTARTLMAIAADSGNAETLLKMPMDTGKTGAEVLTFDHFRDIIGGMPSPEAARDFLNSPLWRTHRDAHSSAVSALLRSRFAEDKDGWVQEFVSRLQIQRSKELVSRRRKQHTRKQHAPRPS